LKVLWVKSGGLVPLDHGGRIRSYQLAKELARKHHVTLFTFYAEQPSDAHTELERVFARVIALPLHIPPAKSRDDYLGYMRNLFSMRPYSQAKYCQAPVAARLRQHLHEESYDVLLCDFLLTAAVIPWEIPCPKVLFTHNIEQRIWERQFRIAHNPLWKAVCYREYRCLARMERHYIQRAERVLAVSETDREFFAGFADPAKIHVIPTGVDLDYFRSMPDSEEPNTLVFTGSMDWLPNEDGIFWFVEQVLPRIRQQIPDVTLWVVGRRASTRLKELGARENGVKVTGTVEDIRPFVARGSVYVVPLLVGGGTRIKIFEAMAMGKAVVSTSIGAEGLPVTGGEDILLADQPEAFAERVVGLLQDSAERRRIGQAARHLVEKDYSWASVAKHLAAVLEKTALESPRVVS
jgi:sugar transferase (PEP-CTERM/EpsH1 system associated)